MTNNTTALAMTDEQWLDLASRHANAEWNSTGYLDSIKAVCADFALLTSPRAAVPAPAGWKLVPIEPTKEMMDAAGGQAGRFTAKIVYTAMLDAAPAAPVAQAVLKAPEGEDPMADGQRGADAGLKRLRAAYCVQQPAPVPDQMALVWRADVMNLALDYGRLAALVKAHIPHAYIAAPSALVPAKNCQTGYADICKVGARDGVACPSDSCDIDDGIRPDTVAQAVAADGAQSWHHELKTDPDVFAAVLAGDKTHEIRYNDRGFKVGDTLRLRETRYSGESMKCQPDDYPLEYTGREVTRVISHVLDGYGLMPGWVVLSFASERAAVSPATADTTWKAPKQHCQNGGDVCLAGNRDGVCCPEDSCDIDDGTRKNPATAGERAAFVEKLRELGADISPLGFRDERLCITSNITVDDVLAAARASQAAAPAEARESAIEKYMWELVDEARRWESAYRDSARRYETLDFEKNSVERTIRFIVSLFPTMVRPAIEYRYTGGTAWCDLGSAETMRADFDGVYRLKAGEFPVWNGDVPADAGEAVAWICSGSNDFAPIVRDRAAALKLSQEHGDGKIVALGIVPDVVSQGAQGGKVGEA
ncbi:ASCH/PUA domain-containing protein [Burkholderia gladioli]|uniref:ASCH/PUA domain-containing protein n=1 Tax=Burkholderia gladioli TaxID=28095 RepID=UPI0019033120|nr:ASCH/PUA domain-containing protein [Burkholderia gladioli]MBJ9709842.1 DUF3850 domain-containing protein [Burkholderia gladioli]